MPISRKGFYDSIYQKVEDQMSYAQKCWLAQPLFCEWLLKEKELPEVVYMDADCFFFSSPQPLFDEIDKAQACATMVPHNFSPSLSHLAQSAGRYCVQFNYFRNSPEGLRVLEKWKVDCLKYDKNHRTSYPGQISLDDWSRIEPHALEIENKGAGVAVWNLENHEWKRDPLDVIFYHFHGLYFPTENHYDFGNYQIPQVVVERIYKPYLKIVEKTNRELEARFPGKTFLRRASRFESRGLVLDFAKKILNQLRLLQRRRRGTYNIFAREKLFKEI